RSVVVLFLEAIETGPVVPGLALDRTGEAPDLGALGLQLLDLCHETDDDVRRGLRCAGSSSRFEGCAQALVLGDEVAHELLALREELVEEILSPGLQGWGVGILPAHARDGITKALGLESFRRCTATWHPYSDVRI